MREATCTSARVAQLLSSWQKPGHGIIMICVCKLSAYIITHSDVQTTVYM